AQVLLKLSSRDERELSIFDIMNDVRSRFANFTDAIVTVGYPSFAGGQESAIQLEISGPDLNALEDLARKGEQLASDIPGFIDVDTTVRMGKPELRITPNRAVLSDLNLPATSLGTILRGNLEGIEAGTFKKDARNYDIVVELEEEEGKDQVEGFVFPGAPGKSIILPSLGHISEQLAPVQITRKDKSRISTIYANLESWKPMGTAVIDLSESIDASASIPSGYRYSFAGEYEMMAESQGELGEAGLLAILLVILTLSAILESFKQPWLILVTIPLAVIGVLWALWLAGESLGIFIIMGCVMLIGIVVNNAILIIDQFNLLVSEGISRHKAMVTAACDRFRPIAMITLAAVLGMLPLALSSGISAEMRNGIGVASVGGILISGILTLVAIPVLYDLMTRRGNNKRRD
ncbi:MAG: efflux RND transporter permease subunit, partial [Candidatus Coatesbacteria bacterium]|nr:efflux RND transporter permease subunit [Candidatus Coatesbacteria bacterium]